MPHFPPKFGTKGRRITGRHRATFAASLVAILAITLFAQSTRSVSASSTIQTYDQCSNDLGTGYTTGDTGCRWINGNLQSNNSTYMEGDATVQRLALDGLAPGSVHSVTLQYGTTKSGKHAYDYLTSWDYSENWITVADRCQDIAGCTSWAEDTSLAIPVDPNAAFGAETPPVVQPAGRHFTFRNAVGLSATTPTVTSGTYAGDSETSITLSFTVTSDTSQCTTKSGTTTCSVAIWFGAHVAKSTEWASGGAATVPGSPYHVALDMIDSTPIGQRDNQMQANAIVAPTATLTLHKIVSGGTALATAWTLSATGPTTISGADGSPAVTTASVPTGIYTLAENGGPTGYTASLWTCTNNVTVTSSQITLASGQTTTCTITNTANAKASPTLPTTPSAGGAIGTVLNDTATVTGGNSPTGSVVFNLYGPNDATCANTAIYTQTVTLSGGSATTSPGFTTTAAGTYEWTASYAGDTNNNPTSSGCGAEAVTIGKASPTLPTTSSAGGAIGTVLNDTATVTGGNSPTGSVVFNLYGPNDATCAGTVIYTQTVTLSGGSATTSPGFTTTAAGTYEWTASYAGDSNNNSASSGCGAEAVSIGKASPTLPTKPSSGGAIGTVLNDTATVTGGNSPTGSVVFNLYGPNDATCANTAIYTQTVTLSGGSATTSPGFTTTAAGTYEWTASYAGDSNNNSASSGCGAEAATIGKASPTLPTTPSGGGAIGTVLNDTATVTGGNSPTGNVVFNLYGPNDATCANTAIYTQTVTLSGGSATTSPFGFTTTAAGTYEWTASYAGDSNNGSASSGCGQEAVTVDKSSPTLPTIPSAGGTVGTVLNDFATVTGGQNPTGDVLFSLYFNDNTCDSTPVYTQTVPLTAGSASTSPGFTTLANGTYDWTASYSGDANNDPAFSGCGQETVIISAAPTLTLTKTPDASSVNAGSQIGFTITATISGTGTLNPVTVTDTLPTNSGTSWTIDAAGSSSGCSISAGILSCNFGPLSSGGSQSKHVHIVSMTTTATCGLVNNSADASYTVFIQSLEAVSNQGSAHASSSVSVQCPPPPPPPFFPPTPPTGTATVIKHVTNTHGGTLTAANFNIHVKNSTGNDVTNSPQAGSETGTAYTLGIGTYTVSEDAPPAGYVQVSITCDGNNTASFTVASAGDTHTCTVTNSDTAATLIVKKHVVNATGTATASQFTMTVTGSSPSPASFPGSESGTTVTLNAGTYSVSETQLLGYTATMSTDCSGTIAIGQTKTCTVTNTQVVAPAGTVTVIKHVINTGTSATGTAANFNIHVMANGVDVANSPQPGSETGTAYTLNPGTYTVSEDALPAGYAQVSISCDGANIATFTITGAGDTHTCTITNQATPVVIPPAPPNTGNSGPLATGSMAWWVLLALAAGATLSLVGAGTTVFVRRQRKG